MPYVTREDGERFIIPSYRDVLSAKKQSLLKQEILALSTNYGAYITLQRKNISQYEVTFSPEPGYLLGETVWHYFKRPIDLIYCEAIPNTAEAILVIVKGGSVYLDGVFPLDSIPEDLIIFKTQQNNFNIYVYGDVPISKTPEEGKFSFDASSVKSFTVLDSSVFAKLPLVRSFQLQLVEAVLKAQGIGVFPVRKVLGVLVIVGLIWMAWTFITSREKVLPQAIVGTVNPYQLYTNALTSPDPETEMQQISDTILRLFTIPGWIPTSVDYTKGNLSVAVKSKGARTGILFDWAKQNQAIVDVEQSGFYLTLTNPTVNRRSPTTINSLKYVIADIVDRLSYILPGNRLQLGAYNDRKVYMETVLTISFTDITPATFNLIGQQFRSLPLVLTKVSFEVNNGRLSGSIVLQALGN